MSGNPITGSTGSGTGTSGVGGPCGACRFLRRKCVAECIFAPYFVSEQGAAHFAAVHKVFGASNVTKLLMHIPVNKRLDAVITLSYEAHARIRDPVYGCVAQIFALQQQVANLQAELSYFQAHLATLETVAPSPPPPLPQIFVPTAGLSITDLPTTRCMPTDYDLSSLLDPTLQPSSLTMQRIHTPAEMSQPQGDDGSGDGNVQELARFVAVPCSSGTSLPLHGKCDERA